MNNTISRNYADASILTDTEIELILAFRGINNEFQIRTLKYVKCMAELQAAPSAPKMYIPPSHASETMACMEVIENSHVNLGLLMTEIRNKVESCSWENPHDSAALQSILCFTDCAQLNVSQIRENVCTLSDLITPLMPEAAHV